ncbi:MAG: 6-bladed beta-propeller [Balneolaceae bacterium]
MKKISGIIVVLLVFGIILYIAIRSDNSGINEAAMSEDIDREQIIDQPVTDRNWSSVSPEPIILNPDIEDSLFNAMILRSYDNFIYVGDYAGMKIRRFLPDGTYVNEIGYGTGQGPGEFSQFMDFFVSGDTISVLDLRTFLVSQFDINENVYLHAFEVRNHPMRLAGLRNQIVIHSIGGELLFSAYDKSGTELGEFGNIIEGQMRNPLSVQGELIPNDESDGFIFVPAFAGYLFYFTGDGSLEKIIRIIDQREFQESEERVSGSTRVVGVPDSDRKVEGISKYNGMLYILTLKKSSEESANNGSGSLDTIIDIYELDTGIYQYSLSIPETMRALTVTENRLFLIRDYDRKVIAYDLDT